MLLLVTAVQCYDDAIIRNLDPSQQHRHRHVKHADKHSPHASFVRQLASVDEPENGGDQRPKRNLEEENCPNDCALYVYDMHKVRSKFLDFLEDAETRLVHFRMSFVEQGNLSAKLPNVMDVMPYMENNFHASEWVWASGTFARKLLDLPLDSNVLSLYILDATKRSINLQISASPSTCLLMHTPECRLDTVRKMLIGNVTLLREEVNRQLRAFVCHRVISRLDETNLGGRLVYRCCDTSQYLSGENSCDIYTSSSREIAVLQTLIDLLSFLVVLFSPLILLRVKMALKYENVTKFFRASLKHGITGQRNYVIRISSRQLVNLADPKPFSIPRVLFRLLFHCYGEGRCLIHCWGSWRAQPPCCRVDSLCRRIWLALCRLLAIFFMYPLIVYVAFMLYIPTIDFYRSIMTFVAEYNKPGRSLYLTLDVTALGAALIPGYWTNFTLWLLFSLASFLYAVTTLMWPGNPLERCLLEYDGRRPKHEPPYFFHKQMAQGYKGVLQRFAYGDAMLKRHLFRVALFPWGLRRLFLFMWQLIVQIPIVRVLIGLVAFDSSLFQLRSKLPPSERDETKSRCLPKIPSHHTIIQWSITMLIWGCFAFILSGYCTVVFVVAQFSLNVIFFTFLASVLNASTILPLFCFAGVVTFYVNDALSTINRQHCDILKLIDENSPRISALEDSTENASRDGLQILKTHNLGAVKFIDADNVHYVSKELYYNVCQDLECGWSRSLRRLAVNVFTTLAFVLFTFASLIALGSFFGSNILISIAAIGISLSPKFLRAYSRRKHRNNTDDERLTWSKMVPEILDRHIRVDSTKFIDEFEEDLTTYDVRPVGLLEMMLPRMETWRTLVVWKFPWTVSADQQTHSPETFVIAFANKQAAAAFLTKVSQ